MTRTLFTWTIGASLLACSSTTRIHMEAVENGGAAGEAGTTADDANTGGSRADATNDDGTTAAEHGDASSGAGDEH